MTAKFERNRMGRCPAGLPRKLGAVSSVMPRRPSMAGKLERIEQLDRHGLNTPRIMLIPIGSTFDGELRSRMLALARGDALMTVRTYHPTDEITYAKGPFAPEVPVEEAMLLAEELARDWNVLFQEAIDIHATILAGNIAVSADGAGSYEALAGRYRVREVEDPPSGAEADLRTGEFARPGEIGEPWVREAVERTLKSGLAADVADERRVLLEINVQREPVGRRREPLLFWEWRPLPAPAGGYRRAKRLEKAGRYDRLIGVGVPKLTSAPFETQLEATLGGKGAGLARALRAGLPVPPFLVLGATDLEPSWIDSGSDLENSLRALDGAAKDFFGDDSVRRLAVRSSPTASMPGMLDTVLHVAPDRVAVADAIREVLTSWNADRAREYRREHAISEHAGLAVILQPMVDATCGRRAGSGVGFTRHPTSGENHPEIEFVEGAQGAGLVGGDALPLTTDAFRGRWPELFAQIAEWCRVLERLQGDVQEFEFAFEDGVGCLLQTRRAKRTAGAALQIAYDLVHEGVIDLQQAREALLRRDIGQVVERRLAAEAEAPIGTGRTASPGVAVGRAAIDAAGADRIIRAGNAVIFLSRIPSPSDYPLLRRSAAVVSSRGGTTSHASVVALDAGIPAVVGCRNLTVGHAEHAVSFGSVVVREGDWLSVDAATAGGAVYLGRLAERVPSRPAGLSSEIMGWARSLVL